MKSHSIKNKEVHECHKCGKCFDSIRAMLDHMKSHLMPSKASKVNDDGLSDLESVLPIFRKRSRINYKRTFILSLSSLNGLAAFAV